MMAALVLAAVIQADPAGVDQLSWMVGTWREEKAGRTVVETWLPALGGQMAGVAQTLRSGRPPSVEFTTISQTATGLTFTARIDGQPATSFPLIASGEGEAVFENKAHDFPQRVIYRRCGLNLCARIEGVVNGQLKSQSWTYAPAGS
jgi:hypothetical protein